MNYIDGDLIKLALSGEFDVIVHGCNCFCTMGAGIAKAIKFNFPEAFDADCETDEGSMSKLGDISYAQIVRGDKSFFVVNAYTQFQWKGRGKKVDYDGIRIAFGKIRTHFSGKRIGYPMIGAGLAGGDWEIIASIIDGELKGENHRLVKFVT